MLVREKVYGTQLDIYCVLRSLNLKFIDLLKLNFLRNMGYISMYV